MGIRNIEALFPTSVETVVTPTPDPPPPSTNTITEPISEPI